MKTRSLLTAIFVGIAMPLFAGLPLTESTFTEIIRQANVVTAADKSVTPAKANETFKVPDYVRTGMSSRVELTAPDKTITRVGANTIFTFAPDSRDILLERGSVLFHSPAGAGGGAIKHRGTAAAVLGTTELAVVLPDGSFKIIDLEGNVKVTFKNLPTLDLGPGQAVVVRPDGESFGPIENFNLGLLVPQLVLVMGFSTPLSSMPLIQAAIRQQNNEFTGIYDPLPQVEYDLDLVLNPNRFNQTKTPQSFISPTTGYNP